MHNRVPESLVGKSGHSSTVLRIIGLMSSVFANGPGDRGSIPARVIPGTQKTVLDVALLNTQHYKVRIKSSGAIQGMKSRRPLHLGVVATEKGAFESSSTKVVNFTNYILVYKSIFYLGQSCVIINSWYC